MTSNVTPPQGKITSKFTLPKEKLLVKLLVILLLRIIAFAASSLLRWALLERLARHPTVEVAQVSSCRT